MISNQTLERLDEWYISKVKVGYNRAIEREIVYVASRTLEDVFKDFPELATSGIKEQMLSDFKAQSKKSRMVKKGHKAFSTQYRSLEVALSDDKGTVSNGVREEYLAPLDECKAKFKRFLTELQNQACPVQEVSDADMDRVFKSYFPTINDYFKFIGDVIHANRLRIQPIKQSREDSAISKAMLDIAEATAPILAKAVFSGVYI